MTVEHRRYPGHREHCPVCRPPGIVGRNEKTDTLFVWKVGPSCSHYECSECGAPYGGVESPCEAPTTDPAVQRARHIEKARLQRAATGAELH
jgi:hypothetical protein